MHPRPSVAGMCVNNHYMNKYLRFMDENHGFKSTRMLSSAPCNIDAQSVCHCVFKCVKYALSERHVMKYMAHMD
jgi:hypothetical protein